jgi:hypothetical protein
MRYQELLFSASVLGAAIALEQSSPSTKYAPGTAHFPARNSATIKLTHYPSGDSGVSLETVSEKYVLVNAETWLATPV